MVNIEILGAKFRRNKLKGIVFDLDDTLLNTSKEFIDKMTKFSETVALGTSGKTFEEVYAILRELNNQSYEKYAVRRSRWKQIVEEMKVLFEKHEHSVLDDAYQHLNSMFETPIELVPGAFETAQTFSEMEGIFLGLVTHGREKWSYRKLAWTGLDKFFNSENVCIVDEKVHKGPKHWKEGIKGFSLRPPEVLIVGDSLSGDIIAAHEAGMEHKVWIQVPGGWSKYTKGEVPEGTHVISSISELLNKLLEVL